jgi:hypothetical protein
VAGGAPRRELIAGAWKGDMARTTRATGGKWFLGGKALLVFRRTGQVVTHVMVLEKSFRIRTPDLGTLTFAVEQIQSIVFRNLPAYPTDTLRTVGGSEINGRVLNDPVHVDAGDLGGKKTLARSKILSIVF